MGKYFFFLTLYKETSRSYVEGRITMKKQKLQLRILLLDFEKEAKIWNQASVKDAIGSNWMG